MAASGYTPIILLNSGTTGHTPTTGNLAVGELAINYTDGKLYYNTGSAIAILANAASQTPVTTFSAGTTGFTPSTATSGAVTLSGTLATTNGGTGLTSFTANGVVYASSTSALATGSGLLFDASTTFTIAPTGGAATAFVNSNNAAVSSSNVSKLILGDVGTGRAHFASYRDGSGQTELLGNAFLTFALGSPSAISEKMRLTSAGYLGIGTSSPNQPLTISTNPSSSSSPSIYINPTTGTNGSIIGFNNSGSGGLFVGRSDSSGNGSGLTLTAYDSFLATTGTTGISFNTNSTQAMYISSGQKVGIGTSSPSYPLDITADPAASIAIGQSSDDPFVWLDRSDGGSNRLAWRLRESSTRQLIFETGTSTTKYGQTFTQAMTLDNSGNLLIGTTSQQGKVAINGVATSAPLVTFYSSTAGDVGQAGLLIGKQDNNTTTSQIILRASILSTGSGAGQINMNGANSLAFGTYSDQRLKENIVDIPPQLANIMALRPVEFDYIESEGGGHQTGFIAQEIQKVYSDSVGEREDGMLTVSGWSKTEARLVKAIQELNAEIQSLKAEVATLKGA